MSGNEIENIYKKRNKSFDLFLFVFYIILTFILYYSSIQNFFVLDDFTVLLSVVKGSMGANFHFYPVPLFLYRIIYLIFGLDPAPVRILIILLNSLICLYVFKLSYKLFDLFDESSSARTKIFKSLLCSLIFCVHYIHVETIVYYSELHEILYSFFYITGIYSYLSFRKNDNKFNYALIFILYLFCLFSKETAVTFLICIGLSEIILFKSKLFDFIKKYYLLFVITLFFAVLRYFIYPKFDAFVFEFSLLQLISETLKNLIFTFTAFITSLDFMLIKDIYRMNNSGIISTFTEILQKYPAAIAGLIISLLVYAVILRKSPKIIYISFAFILVSILSFIWLVGYERYLYLPSVGFCVMVVHHLFNVPKVRSFKRKIIFPVVFLFIIYNIYCLEIKKNNWEIASAISYNTVMNIRGASENLPADSEVYFKNLPSDHNGAWILRGFVIREIPELFLNRNDLFFYNMLEKQPEKTNTGKTFIYDCKDNSLTSF